MTTEFANREILIRPWKRGLSSFIYGDRSNATFSHSFFCCERSAICTVHALETFTLHEGTEKNVIELALEDSQSSENEVFFMNMISSVPHALIWEALRESKYLERMKLPKFVTRRPTTTIKIRQKRGLPIMTKDGQIYAGNNECLYRFSFLPPKE